METSHGAVVAPTLGSPKDFDTNKILTQRVRDLSVVALSEAAQQRR